MTWWKMGSSDISWLETKLQSNFRFQPVEKSIKHSCLKEEKNMFLNGTCSRNFFKFKVLIYLSLRVDYWIFFQKFLLWCPFFLIIPWGSLFLDFITFLFTSFCKKKSWWLCDHWFLTRFSFTPKNQTWMNMTINWEASPHRNWSEPSPSETRNSMVRFWSSSSWLASFNSSTKRFRNILSSCESNMTSLIFLTILTLLTLSKSGLKCWKTKSQKWTTIHSLGLLWKMRI